MATPTAQAPIPSEPIAAATTPTTTSQNDAPPEKLKGLKLAVLLGSITLVTFLALLDTSIVGTVTNHPISAYTPSQPLTKNVGYTRHNY
jgi:hypothetical protein